MVKYRTKIHKKRVRSSSLPTLLFLFSKHLQRNVFYECFHGFVGCQTQAVVQMRLYRGCGLRYVARTDVRRCPGKVRSPSGLWCFRIELRFARNSSGLMGTAISMFSISHSAHAPRYIQMRQSFSHLAPFFLFKVDSGEYGIRYKHGVCRAGRPGRRQRRSGGVSLHATGCVRFPHRLR